MYPRMKEMGGYFEFERFYGAEYYNDLLRFDSVRSCFMFIVEQRKYKKIYLPFYLCACIKDVLRSYQITYEFYAIDREFKPILGKEMEEDECLFFVNYLGKFSNNEIICCQKKYKNIFVDNTQSFFQKPVKEIDTAYSCRKYFGISDGAYLNTALNARDVYEMLPFYISHDKMIHIAGRFEISAASYFDIFVENEKINRGQPIKKMSLLSQNILKGIDYHQIINKRLRNMNFVADNLNGINKAKIKNNAGLFYYPLLLENGKDIKQKLIKARIYVPTLWPNVLDDVSKNSFEYFMTDNMIFLPIDQRYDENDMKYMLDVLKEVLSGDDENRE
jgi:hypothetical protein